MGLLDDKWFDGNWGKPKTNPRKIEARANQALKKRKTRRGKKVKIPWMSYRIYIQSKWWKRRKSIYYKKNGKKCAVCGSKKKIALHHKVYNVKKYGREPDEHLVALCSYHHNEFHKNFDLKADMRYRTDEYITTAKQLRASKIDDLSWI